jgi:hypothetical protein
MKDALADGIDIHGGLRIRLKDGVARCGTEPGVDPGLDVEQAITALQERAEMLRVWLIQWRRQQQAALRERTPCGVLNAPDQGPASGD